LPHPPEVIIEVCSIAFFLYPGPCTDVSWLNIYPGLGTDVSWLNIKKKLLGDPQLLNRLVSYEVSKTKADQAKRAKQKMGTLANSLSF